MYTLPVTLLAAVALASPTLAGQAQLHSCRAEGAGPALCARVVVPENRATRQGRRLSLNVVYLPAMHRQAADDSIATLSGGPGEGAAHEIGLYSTTALLRRLRQRHSLLFVDSRGTGSSDPLTCAWRPTSLQASFDTVLQMGSERDIALCRAHLAKVADLSWYRTDAVADDLEDVRRTLGIRTLTLVGTSGGTLTAVVYARRHPEHLRAIMLGGANLPSSKIPYNYTRARQYVLDNILRLCSDDPACRSAYPNLRSEFTRMLSDLRNKPMVARIQSQNIRLTFAVFVETLGEIFYSEDSVRNAPLLLHAASHGDWGPFFREAIPIRKALAAGGVYGLSRGFYLSVTCSEDVPFISASDLDKASGTFIATSRIVPHQRACAIWHVPAVPASWTETVSSTVPTLIVNEAYDPATPIWGAREALRRLPNGRLVVENSFGHVEDWDCFQTMEAQFVESAKPDSVNASCARTKPLPFRTATRA